MKIFVIAGNIREFNEYRRNKELTSNSNLVGSEYVYVSDSIKVRGIRDPHGVFIGTWKQRPDIYQIVEALMFASMPVNKALQDVYNSVKPKTRPTPKLTVKQVTAMYTNEAARMMAQEIDNEVLEQLTGQKASNGTN